MAKPPPLEYFEVTVRCPKEMLGDVMSDMKKRGITEVNFDLVTAVKTFNRNVAPGGVNSVEFLTDWIKDRPTFRANEAAKAFVADGRSSTVAYPALTALIKKGILKKLGPGEYSRADVKALPAPKKTKKQAAQQRKTFDKRGEDVILSYAKRNHGRFNTQKLVEIFLAEGRARNSIYASIDALAKAKLVKRVGDAGSGQYVLLAKAASKPKSKPKTPPVTNGHAAEAAEA